MVHESPEHDVREYEPKYRAKETGVLVDHRQEDLHDDLDGQRSDDVFRDWDVFRSELFAYVEGVHEWLNSAKEKRADDLTE